MQVIDSGTINCRGSNVEPDKLIDFASRHLSEQAWGILATLQRPRLLFPPVAGVPVNTQSVESDVAISTRSERLPSNALVFFAINLLIGTTVNKLIRARKQGPDLLTTVCFSFGSALLI